MTFTQRPRGSAADYLGLDVAAKKAAHPQQLLIDM